MSLPIRSVPDTYKNWDVCGYFDSAQHVLAHGQKEIQSGPYASAKSSWFSGYAYAASQDSNSPSLYVGGTLAAHPYLGGDVLVAHNSLWDIASIVKSVPLSMLIFHVLQEDKGFALDDPITKFVPTLTVTSGDTPTVRDFLSFGVTFGLNQPKPYSQFPPDELEKQILSSRIWRSPFKYSNYAPFILRVILEKIMGQRFDVLARNMFFDPLGLRYTTFTPDIAVQKIASTEVVNGVQLVGVPHDDLTRALGSNITGISGLFSCPQDLHALMRVFLEEGTVKGRQIFSPDLISMIGMDQLGGWKNAQTKHIGSGLGFGLVSELMRGYDMSPILERAPQFLNGAFFRSSFTGCLVAVFPALKFTVTLCTNSVHPKGAGRKYMSLLRHVFLNQFFGCAPQAFQQLFKS